MADLTCDLQYYLPDDKKLRITAGNMTINTTAGSTSVTIIFQPEFLETLPSYGFLSFRLIFANATLPSTINLNNVVEFGVDFAILTRTVQLNEAFVVGASSTVDGANNTVNLRNSTAYIYGICPDGNPSENAICSGILT